MSFGSFLRGIVAQVNPFDNGQTYSTYNPPEKKRPDQAPQWNSQTGFQPAPQPNNIPTNQSPVDFGKLQVNNNVNVPSQNQNNGSHGFLHDLTHNPVTDVVGGIAKAATQPFTYLAKADIINPTRELAAQLTGNQQAQANAQRQSNIDLGLGPSGTDLKSGLEKLAGNSAGALLTVAAPGASKLIEGGVSRILPEAAPSVFRTVVPKAIAGSQIGGAFNTAGAVANGDTSLPDLAKAYGEGAVVGGALDAASPYVPKLINKVAPKVVSRLMPQSKNLIDEASAESQPTRIPIQTDVPVSEVKNAVNVPVKKTPGKLIQEVGGDAKVATTSEQVAQATDRAAEAARQAANDRFNAEQGFQASTTTPNPAIEGVKPRPAESPTYVTSADVQNERAALDQALANKEITKTQHKAANQALDNTPTIDAPKPSNSKQIQVKQAASIGVQQPVEVPANLPVAPGKVRVTTQTAPVQTQDRAIAGQTPAPAPGATPKLTKAQVASAKNQERLAKQLSKSKTNTQDVLSNMPELAPKPEGSPGFVPTGELRRGANGNISEVAHGSTEAAQAAVDTANLSSGDVLNKATQEIAQNGVMSPESVRNLDAMIGSGRFPATSPEYQAMSKALYGAGSDYGRGLSLFNPTMRRTASGDQLANRFISKLYGVSEDGTRITEQDIAAVQQAESNFATARDTANQALDQYNATKSPADFAAWKQAQQVAEDTQKQSLITEYQVANNVLKGNKDPVALKAIQQAKKDAGVYQMDWIDANMLSGTGTATRNYVNTALVRLENRIFGGRGYSSKGAKIGNEIGNRSVVTDFKARQQLDQNKLSKLVGQWSTTANTLGEGNIRAVGTARAYKYYENQLKSQGVTGDQLRQDVEVALHTDPEKIVQHYEQWALTENALSGLAHSKKLEQQMVDAIASHGGGQLTQTGAKAIVRLTVGFPTVIGRSLVGGLKRATLGVPDLMTAGKAFANGDKQTLTDALYSAKVHGGSGALLYALGTALASAGIISPSYPSDKAEQQRWKSEGIQPNSIKIAGQWFQIPGYFGALALPFTLPADIINKSTPGDIAKGAVADLEALSPVSGLTQFIDGMEGRAGGQWLKNEITSVVRAGTPVGSLLNQIAKMTDSTKNDTTTKDAISNLLDNIAAGIPGLNNAVNTIPATDANGNILHNPNPVATLFGAQGADQQQGKQDVQSAQNEANKTYGQLKDYGVIDNPNLMGLVDKKIQAQIQRGQDLSPEDLKKVEKAVTKGIGTGISADSDSNWRENGDYGTDRSAMQVKLQMLQADPTAKKSEISNIKTQIARDDVLEKNKISYEDLKLYEDTSQTEWAHMGRSDNEAYDPATYDKLKQIDDLLTKAGGSYKSGDPTKNKYDAHGGGSGYGKKAPTMSTDFGQLDTSGNPFAPKVRQYKTADLTGTSSIPVVSVVRPNIVHKITNSKVK